MYSLIEFQAIPRGLNQRWVKLSPSSPEILTSSVQTLQAKYRRVILKLSPGGGDEPIFVELSEILPYGVWSDRLFDALLKVTPGSLQPLVTPMQFKTQTAVWMDAFRANFHVAPWSAKYGVSATPEEKRDSLLTHADHDYQILYHNVLATVCGYVHRTDTDGTTGLVIKEANATRLRARMNTLGLLSLWSVAPIEQVGFSPAQILEYAPNRPLVEDMIVKVTPTRLRLTSSSVFFVICGKIVGLSSPFVHRVSEDQWRIQLKPMGILEQVVAAWEKLDLSSLNLAVTPKNATQVSVDQVFTNEVVKRLMQLTQTFAVVVDCPDLFMDTHAVRRVGLEGVYETPVEPIYPLLFEDGTFAEYWYSGVNPDHLPATQWRLYAPRVLHQKKVSSTIDPHTAYSIDRSVQTVEGRRVPQAHFLQLGRDY